MANHNPAVYNGPVNGERQRRAGARWLVLLALSLALHAIVLFFLSRSSGDERPAVATTRPVEMDLRWIDVEPEAAPPSAPSAAGERPKTSAPAVRAAQGEGRAETAAVADGTASNVGTKGDLPLAKGTDLTPGVGFLLRLPQATDREPSHGSTVRNGPGEVIDESVAREYEGEVLTRKMNAELLSDVAQAASDVGTAPPHFRKLEAAMREKIKDARINRTPRSDGETIADVARVVLAPTISPEAARKVTDTPLGRSVQMQTVPTPNIEDQRFRESALQLMSRAEAIKEAAHATRLRTVLEVTTDATGAVAEVTVLEKSGDREFDESVLHFSRKVARSLPDDDERGLGTSWWKTRWQFTWEPPDVRVKLVNAQRLPAPQ